MLFRSNEYFASAPQTADSLDSALDKVLGNPNDVLRSMRNDDLLGKNRLLYPQYLLLATKKQGDSGVDYRYVSTKEQDEYMLAKADEASKAQAALYEGPSSFSVESNNHNGWS